MICEAAVPPTGAAAMIHEAGLPPTGTQSNRGKDSDAEPLPPPARPPPATRAELDAEYPLPPPVPNRPCARRDLGRGKKYATRTEYDAALQAWQRADQSKERRAMRAAREQAQSRMWKRDKLGYDGSKKRARQQRSEAEHQEFMRQRELQRRKAARHEVAEVLRAHRAAEWEAGAEAREEARAQKREANRVWLEQAKQARLAEKAQAAAEAAAAQAVRDEARAERRSSGYS